VNQIHNKKGDKTIVVEMDSMRNYDDILVNITKLLLSKNNIYTTADIVHDDAQDNLTGDERWIRV